MKPMRRLFPLVLLLAVVAANSQQSTSKIEQLLISKFGAKPADLSAFRRGEAFVTASKAV